MTKPPHARFTEASLVKKLDELGIGRPSTYASMINKVQQRNYVELKTKQPVNKEISTFKYTFSKHKVDENSKTIKVDGDKNKLFPSGLGTMVNSFLVKEFVDLLDYGFTAKVETMLDEIAQGKKIWNKVVAGVYDIILPVIDRLNVALKDNSNQKIDKIIGIHPNSGNEIKIITTRFGLAICEKFPNIKESKYATLTCPPEDMTLEKALMLLSFPKKLGTYQGKDVLLAKAKTVFFKYDGKNYSIDIYNKSHSDDLINTNEDQLVNITVDDAIKVIKDRGDMESLAANEVKINKDITIKNGRFGYYIKHKGKTNIPLPKKDKESIGKTLTKDSLSLDRLEEIIKKYFNKKAGIKENTTNIVDTNVDTNVVDTNVDTTNNSINDSNTESKTSGRGRDRGTSGRGRGTSGRGRGTSGRGRGRGRGRGGKK
jgi:DNA topoisomerase I